MQVTTLGAQLGLGSELIWLVSICNVCLVICWLICRRGQTIDYVLAQTVNLFRQSFYSWSFEAFKDFGMMNTQNLSTLQVFQSLSRKCKSHFLQSYPKEFIRFLCECIRNLLKGSLQTIKRHHVVKFQIEVWLLSLKRTTRKQRKNVLTSKKGWQLKAVITRPVINHLFWYGSLFSSQLLCLTRVWLRNLLQSRIFQSIKLNNLPRTKLIV